MSIQETWKFVISRDLKICQFKRLERDNNWNLWESKCSSIYRQPAHMMASVIHTFTLSPFHTFIYSHFHTVILSNFHSFIQAICNSHITKLHDGVCENFCGNPLCEQTCVEGEVQKKISLNSLNMSKSFDWTVWVLFQSTFPI